MYKGVNSRVIIIGIKAFINLLFIADITDNMSVLPLGEDVTGTEFHDAERGDKDRYKAGKKEYSSGNCDRHRSEVICEVYWLTTSYVKDGIHVSVMVKN